MAVFPSMKARRLRQVLKRKPLEYRPKDDQGSGSHVTLESPNGYQSLVFAFHDGDTVPPGLVRKVLTKDVGLTEEEALKLL